MKKQSQLKPWHVKNSKYLLKDRWITVRADECVTAKGTVISPYYVLEYPDSVHMIVLDQNHRILITRQYRHGAQKIVAELPCGYMEPHETPLAAAKRELMEETGYTGKFTLAGVTSPNPATHTNNIYTYLVTRPVLKEAPERNPFEVITYEFADLKKILKLIEKKEFFQALHISSLFLGLRKSGVKMPAR